MAVCHLLFWRGFVLTEMRRHKALAPLRSRKVEAADQNGYHVLSSKGKNLGGPYKTRDEAVKRLRQVEFFKRHK
jgi:hypothetical protein